MTLEEIRKLCDKATPGPWSAEHDAIYTEDENIGTAELPKDAQFIAAARTYMPLLLAIAEAARDAIQTAPLTKALDDLGR